MASYQHILQDTASRFESPAKVFAKLKSKVHREGTCGNDGVYTRKAPLGNVKEKHGAEFKSPRKRTDSTWIADELKENRGYGSVSEAQPLTISPISSPQKTFGYTYSDRIIEPADDIPPFSERGHGCTPRKGGFLESKAVPQPFFMVNRKQILTEPPQMRDLDGFNVIHRTPVKIQAGENEFVLEEDHAPPVSSSSMFSPMRNKLRKRKLEPWGLNNVSSSTGEVASKSCAFGERQTPKNTCTADLGNLKGFSVGRSEKNQFTHESMFPPPRSTVKTRCNAIMDKGPLMSPAKMFAYMKERESKAEQQEGRNLGSSARDLFGRNCQQSRDVPPSAVNSTDEDVDSTSAAESMAPGSQSSVESADSQSDTDPSKDVLIPAVPSQPVLLEDPLILNSPRVSIPKKYEAAYKPKNWPLPTDFPCESVIYLKRWFLRRNRKGLFVDGIHREENIPWNSNIISERVSNCVLQTITGRVYILVGKMNLHVNSGFPKWFLKKFNSGFPSNWKELYEKFLLESKNSRKTERNSKGRDSLSKSGSEANFIKPSVKQRTAKPLKTPNNHPPDPSSSTKVSRSGRVIKPPLEYWKGGRVILDAQMNVTIHECYDTSICSPEVTTTVSARASQKPSCVFLPCSDDRQQCEPAGSKETSAPLRKVKSPLRRRNRAKANHSEKPSHSPESPLETLDSFGDQSVRGTRSSQRVRAVERTLLVNSHPQKQTESSSTQRKSKKQKQDTKRPPVTVSGRKRTVSASPASSGRTSNDQSSEEELPSRRTKRRKGVHRKKDEESHDSRMELRKTTTGPKHGDAAKTSQQKQSKSTKTSQPAKPTQSAKRQKADKRNTPVPPEEEEEEDKWTEAELKKLKEAVALYPKHVSSYWAKVARIVGTRSAEECHHQHTSQGASQSPAKKAKKPKKRPSEAPKDQDKPMITARVGTFKRKQEVRQFLENMPRDNVDDIFSCSYMKNKRFEMPTAYTSSLSDDHDFALSDLEPVTPMSTHFPEVKTPQCLHITPGMIGSPNRGNDDKYVYQLQKRMKKSQFNVCKQAPKKNFTPTPSVKRTMKRCGNTENDTFVVWEMFPGKDAPLSDSEEEKDFYFSDND